MYSAKARQLLFHRNATLRRNKSKKKHSGEELNVLLQGINIIPPAVTSSSDYKEAQGGRALLAGRVPGKQE